MNSSSTIELPMWISGDQTKAWLDLSHDHLKREARKGKLVQGHHFIQLGEEKNSKYRWHLPHLIEHYSSRKLPAPPPKSY